MSGKATRTKSTDRRPARARYWRAGVLKRKKLANLGRCCGLGPGPAFKRWAATRTRGPFRDGLSIYQPKSCSTKVKLTEEDRVR